MIQELKKEICESIELWLELFFWRCLDLEFGGDVEIAKGITNRFRR